MAAADGTPEYLNTGAAGYLGSAATTPPDWDLRHLGCCEQADRVASEWARARHAQTGFDLDCRLRRADGCYRWHQLRVRPIRDQLGTLLAWFGTATDTDDTTQLHEQLESARRTSALSALSAVASQRQLAEAQQIAELGSFEKDLVTGAMTWSAELYRLLGVDPTQPATLELFLAHVYPDDRARFTEAHATALRSGAQSEVVHRIVRGDHELRWVESRATGEFAADGSVVTLVGTMRDTTGRREADRRQEEAQTRFETGFEQAGIGTAIFDLDGTTIRVNQAVCTLLGRSENDLVGHTWSTSAIPTSPPSMARWPPGWPRDTTPIPLNDACSAPTAARSGPRCT